VSDGTACERDIAARHRKLNSIPDAGRPLASRHTPAGHANGGQGFFPFLRTGHTENLVSGSDQLLDGGSDDQVCGRRASFPIFKHADPRVNQFVA
jgi:hypothetical protein